MQIVKNSNVSKLCTYYIKNDHNELSLCNAEWQQCIMNYSEYEVKNTRETLKIRGKTYHTAIKHR